MSLKESVTVKTIAIDAYPELELLHPFALANQKNITIAGGAPRDIALGESFRDVDCFIGCYTTEDLITAVAKVVLFCSKNGLEMTQVSGEYSNELDTTGDLRVIGLIKTKSIDFVFVPRFKTPIKLVQEFDTTTSQAWLQATEEGFDVMTTGLFQELNHRKIIGIYPTKTGSRTGHAKRMLERFPDFLALELVAPDKCMPLELVVSDMPMPKSRISKSRSDTAYTSEVPF